MREVPDFHNYDKHEMMVETDIFMWLVRSESNREKIAELIKNNLTLEDFTHPLIKYLMQNLIFEFPGFEILLEHICFFLNCDDFPEMMRISLMKRVFFTRINLERAMQCVKDDIIKKKEVVWYRKREAIRQKIQSGICTDEEASKLIKEFDELKINPPKLMLQDHVEWTSWWEGYTGNGDE